MNNSLASLMKVSFIVAALPTLTQSCSANPADSTTRENLTVADVASGEPQGGSACTSGEYWTGGDRESPLMHPGGECVSCHVSRHEGPRYSVAGTLYASMADPDDCYGVDPSYSAQVLITDADGNEFTLTVNSAGNFVLRDDLALPYTAKVLYNGSEHVMVTPQTEGDCNSCHTSSGANGAPGRIQLPL
jgi:hypothetical protein